MRSTVLATKMVQESIDQERNVVSALTQGRNFDLKPTVDSRGLHGTVCQQRIRSDHDWLQQSLGRQLGFLCDRPQAERGALKNAQQLGLAAKVISPISSRNSVPP